MPCCSPLLLSPCGVKKYHVSSSALVLRTALHNNHFPRAKLARQWQPCAALDTQNMIASIDKLHRAGDPTGEITAQIQCCLPHFFDSDIAAQR